MRQCGVPKAPTSDSLRTRAYQDSATLPEPRPAYASPFSCGVGGPRPMMTHFKNQPRDLARGRFKFRSTASGQIPTDADLTRTIVQGIPSTGMVPQNHLSETE